jgi:hypothetical protein
MTAQTIAHTCSNVHVAGAALASIGGEFASRFATSASRRNMLPGSLAAQMVKEFSKRASNDEWNSFQKAVRGSDQPILAGLRYILSVQSVE